MKPTYEQLLDALKQVTRNAHNFGAWQHALDVIHRAEAKVPYPEHCTRPDQCAGKTECQRIPCCID